LHCWWQLQRPAQPTPMRACSHHRHGEASILALAAHNGAHPGRKICTVAVQTPAELHQCVMQPAAAPSLAVELASIQMQFRPINMCWDQQIPTNVPQEVCHSVTPQNALLLLHLWGSRSKKPAIFLTPREGATSQRILVRSTTTATTVAVPPVFAIPFARLPPQRRC